MAAKHHEGDPLPGLEDWRRGVVAVGSAEQEARGQGEPQA